MVAWTDEIVTEIRHLAAQGLSASNIGNELGITRNAVIGKMRRLKIPLLGDSQGGRRAGDQRPRRKRATLKVPVSEAEPKPLPTNVTLMELVPEGCRWPMGDPGTPEFAYCGNRRAQINLPYCEGHCRMAYRPDGRSR